MAGFLKAAATQDVPAGQGKMVTLGGRSIARFNVAGNYYAIDDSCTHQGGLLSVTGSKVTCPWHGATFDVTTGEVVGPAAPTGVSRFTTSVLWAMTSKSKSEDIASPTDPLIVLFGNEEVGPQIGSSR